AEVLGGEAGAEAAEAGDHLIENEKDAVLGADFPQLLQIAFGRDEDAGRASDGLDDDGGNGRGVVESDDALELVGEMAAPGRLPGAEGFVLEVVGVRQMIHAVKERAEKFAIVDDSADGDAAESDAVIAALAPDQPLASALAADVVVADGSLESGVDRLRAGVGEEDMLEVARQDGGEARGQLEGEWVAHLEGGRIVHLPDLVAHGLDDLLAAVTGVDAPQPGGAVEDLAAVMGRVVHVLRTDEQARLALELPVVGE